MQLNTTITLSFSWFFSTAVFRERKEAMDKTTERTNVLLPQSFIHFKRVLNQEVELEIIVPNALTYNNCILIFLIQWQGNYTSFIKSGSFFNKLSNIINILLQSCVLPFWKLKHMFYFLGTADPLSIWLPNYLQSSRYGRYQDLLFRFCSWLWTRNSSL